LTIRIGLGYDIHRLESGRDLYLGGIKIPYPAGLAGHSDGDCLVHALIDALLGAAGEPDIGRLFPDTDPAYKGIRSTVLLAKVVSRLRRRRWRVLNADLVVVAQAPKLASHIDKMKETLCAMLGVNPGSLGIKAKTNEGLGLIGRAKAAACWAVVLVEKRRAKGDKKRGRFSPGGKRTAS
jgi:2-C-methyl-D-erythritol 2,4-cyclodiphosphate synthase